MAGESICKTVDMKNDVSEYMRLDDLVNIVITTLELDAIDNHE
jgi:hypothetical protein